MKMHSLFCGGDPAEEKRFSKWLLVLAAAGFAAGILTTAWYGGYYPGILGELLFACGQVSTGLFLWAVCCTLIAVSARTPLQASAGVICYLMPMIAGCFIAGKLGGFWINPALLSARLLALIPAALLGAAAWYLRRSEGLRIAALIAGGLLLLFDAAVIIRMEIPSLALLGTLYVAFFTVLRHLAEDQREQILYRRNFMGSCEPLNHF